ncbi:MAG TPA: DUF3048 domain-containing protein [Pseudolysinimonas sp.]
MRGAGTRSVTAGVIALTLTAAILILSGCVDVPMPVPSPAYTSTYVAPPPTTLTPLTGEVIPADTVLGPSLAAKVDNLAAARPQVGLEHTDLVFEELVEGGLTRYVAVWQSDVPAKIGPIRSIRPMDPDIISPLGGIVAYSGGQQRFVDEMKDTNVYNAIHGQPDTADVMFRTDSKPAPHNVIVRAPQLIAKHPDIAPPGQQFSFAPDAAASTAAVDGDPTSKISMRFGAPSTPSWKYDTASGRYLRSQAGAPDLDGSGDRLSAANVIVVRVPIGIEGGVPKTELIGSGDAWISSGGSTVHATWSKSSRRGLLRLVDDTGTVIRLAPGNSWIELVPLSGEVSFTAP